MSGHVVAMGGRVSVEGAAAASLLDEHLLSLTGQARPHVVYLPTATGDSDLAVEGFEARYGGLACTRDVVECFGVPDRPAERVAAADAVVVGGGNTANMDSIYFEDPLGLLIELASYRFEPPHGFTHAEVLLEAHRIRVEREDHHIDTVHLADAIERLVERSRESLSDDRAPAQPYR